ncbi:carboxylesterase family protein [Nannocystis sp. SCPEA4]|uniref:carboxylesterase/lipase family protein n=1 Tax=Nannocystis sp. SCPEA4 TaxID=2996787 RepID=UPI0022717A93|nr:carboxylesterase family protein [Nannocystis sp. SCPEA4]MCY1058210.1 carboxylesterase family protein [Nannocystis sp. SCPEA4]
MMQRAAERLFGVGAALSLALACSTSDESIVETDAGRVRGTLTDEVRLFQGIPYGAPPVGELRWHAPRPASAWTELRDATRPGNRCPQVGTAYVDIESDTEDCLYLNVTTPRGPGSSRPVMVWIHGDGAIGSGDLFDARRLASEGDVVVVTINYRLGVFGGFVYPGLEGSGTFGLQDQQLALQWVQRNAAAFGGDPDNVTLFGVSYGATATTAHMTSPTADGLFHRAILQSGEALMDIVPGSMGPAVPADPYLMWATSAEQEPLGLYVAEQLGCNEPATALACLRGLSVAQILRVPAIMHMFQPYVPGDEVLPENPGEALRAGRFRAMPVLAGHTRDEHRMFVGLFHDLAGAPVSAEQYPDLLTTAFGAQAEAVAAAYPLADYASPGTAWAQLLTHRLWARTTFEQNAAFAERAPVYFYEFAEESVHDLPFSAELRTGALHADEGEYLFGDGSSLTPPRLRLSEAMIRYWTNFARTGDPNGEQLPTWDRFTAATPNVLALAAGEGGIRPIDHRTEHKLEFWATQP